MVCLEFTSSTGRLVRLFGHLAECSPEHILASGLSGNAARPTLGDAVTVTLLIGRNVRTAETQILRIADPGQTRLALKRPAAFVTSDRRRQNRVSTNAPAKWVCLDNPDLSFTSCEIVDVSVGGAMLRASAVPGAEPGARILVALDLPERRTIALAEIRTVRDNPQDGGLRRYGIEFTAVPSLDRIAIDKLTGHA